MRYYPVAVNLKRKDVLVAGGGEVAERKVKALLEAGARVKVVSPDFSAGLKRLAEAGKIRWVKRRVVSRDVFKAAVVIAATSEHDTNRKVSIWAGKAGALVNVVDKPGLSDFISPAVIRKGRVIVAVYTDGKDPVLSRDLKNFLKGHWDVFLSYRNRL